MKSTFSILSFFLSVGLCFSQEAIQQPQSKLDQFTSKSGVLIKFEDFKLPNINTMYGGVSEVRIRKVYSGSDVKFFYQISNEGKYGSKTASVATDDFKELTKALESLKSSLSTDLASPADYLENKFVTEDGLHLGYLVDNKKVTWYVRLEKYGTGNTIFLKSIESLDESFKLAKQKLESLQ